MKQVLMQILTDSNKTVVGKSNSLMPENYWFWIAVIELGIILLLIFKLNKKHKVIIDKTTADLFNISKNSEVNMDDLMNNINKSRDLYKKISTKCHPDRFVENELNKKASELFQEITKNKRNYNRLVELKNQVEQQLNITI